MDRRNFLAVLGAVGASEVIPSWLFKKMASPGLITTEIPRFPISDFYPGELTIIGGRPSMGKTAALYQTALLASVNQNKTVALFSLEKNSTSTVRRLLQLQANLTLEQCKPWRQSAETERKMLDAFKKVAKSNLYIEDRNCPTISEVFEECEKLKEKGELDLVLIDYIQLIKSDQTIVPQLKELAVKFSVPVVVTSQIHQVVEQKENKRPQLRHFIGPSEEELNEYADHVITIFRPDYYKKTFRKSRQVVEVNILKNRYAKPISLSLTWDGNVGKFLG